MWYLNESLTKIAVPSFYISVGYLKISVLFVEINITILSIIRFNTKCQANKHDLILSFERWINIRYPGDGYVCFQIDRQY